MINFLKIAVKCHLTPDWLLIYKIQDDELVLLLFATGSHSDILNNKLNYYVGKTNLRKLLA